MKDMKVMVLQTNGSIEEFRTEWSLKMAQEIVGGLIEAVSLTGATMYINEEGKILGLPANDLATQIWHDDLYKRGCAVGWDVIVGDVLIVGDTDARGNDTSISDAWRSIAYETQDDMYPMGDIYA